MCARRFQELATFEAVAPAGLMPASYGIGSASFASRGGRVGLVEAPPSRKSDCHPCSDTWENHGQAFGTIWQIRAHYVPLEVVKAIALPTN